MGSDFVIRLASETVFTILKVSVPLITIALVVGLLVSIFQATTQIQEQTLAFVPKIVSVFLAVLVFGPWILSVVVDFTYNLISNLHNFIG